MADISVINVGGSDYNVKDATGRSNANTALAQLAYQETGNTASQAYSIIGTPINWKGTLYYTKTAVAKGATWAVGTNLTAATNLGKLTSNIKTYVNSSGKLVFRDLTGADTVLPFSGTPQYSFVSGFSLASPQSSISVSNGKTYVYVLMIYILDYSTVTQAVIDNFTVSGGTISQKIWQIDPYRQSASGYSDYAQMVITVKSTSTSLKLSFNSSRYGVSFGALLLAG